MKWIAKNETSPLISFYLTLCSLVFLFTFLIILLVEPIQLHSKVNSFHSTYFDYFFSMITHLGDGMCAILICIILFFRNTMLAIKMMLALLLISLLIWISKFYLFPDANRPVAVFRDLGKPLYIINHVKMNLSRTFPSGHASTAFLIGCTLAYLSEKIWWQLLCASFSIMVAFSRVYLSQHFTEDVLAGGIIGLVITFLVLHPKLNWRKYLDGVKLNKNTPKNTIHAN
ncbi:phosphatase PAP2 family protein [Ferruginibacter yonginensis]|uniref:Phosphatase PAP2 family protein n=1 Tax=Ferruginibacter yonginensis TaxID=1310416 RepID=A0ABV8QUH0_9BACT